MSDPGKADRTFLLTISWGATAEHQAVLCCKTGALRGPKSARLLVAALGSHSREAAFYTHLAPGLRAAGVRVPHCFHSDVAGLLAHTFFLLEGVTGVTAVTDGATMGSTEPELVVLRSFLTEEATVHAMHWGADDGVDSPLAVLSGSVSMRNFLASSPVLKPHKRLLNAALAFTANTARCPTTLIHGDARLGNALLHPDGRCTLVDWEVAAAGTPLLDVVYCIWMCSEAGTDRGQLAGAAEG